MSSLKDTIVPAVHDRLRTAGWPETEILTQQLVHSDQGTLRPDFILLYNLNRIAVIEVMHPSSSVEAGVAQVAMYKNSLGVPFAFLSNGQSIIEVGSSPSEWAHLPLFPTPAELLARLRLSDTQSEPRVYPAYDLGSSPRLYQVEAVERILDAVVNGTTRLAVQMATGTGVSFVELQVAWKLIGSGWKRRAMVISTRLEHLHQLASRFNAAFEGRTRIMSGATSDSNMRIYDPKVQVEFWSANLLTNRRGEQHLDTLPSDAFDLILLDSFGPMNSPIARVLTERFPDVTIISFLRGPARLGRESSGAGDIVFSYTLEQALQSGELVPPPDYRVVRLDDVAELSSGIILKRAHGQGATGDIPVIGAQEVRASSELDVDLTNATMLTGHDTDSGTATNQDSDLDHWRVCPGDILITVVSPFRVAVAPADFSQVVLFSSSLIRVRPRDATFARGIVEFLRSDAGAVALRQVASGASILLLTPRTLGQVLVFLPPEGERTEASGQQGDDADAQPSELGAVANSTRILESEILPLLQSEEAKAADAVEGGSDVLSAVAARLRQVADTLAPPPFEGVVMETYPTPIALAYRRFHESRFNPFEQVLRLRDVAEAASLFVYHTLLSDLLRNLDPQHFRVVDKGARKAYNGYSMAARFDFIDSILDIASSDGGTALFIPEFTKAKRAVKLAREVHEDLRNRLSHTAAASESQQVALLREFRPKVDEMLSSFNFLPNYPMVRVSGFFFDGGRLFRRMEIYQGVAPQIDEHPLPDEVKPTRAERDHIVLLNAEGEVLDLFPLYQLISDSDTRHEMHLCVFKQRKQGKQSLEGESVSGAFEVALRGFDEFETLQAKLTD